MGARFEALIEGVLMAPLDSRYTQVGFNLISVQVCMTKTAGGGQRMPKLMLFIGSPYPHPSRVTEVPMTGDRKMSAPGLWNPKSFVWYT